ncbi:MAG TPA: hypothetical protein VI776_03230 [Anaerolineales bacterium]|nr:hypothetical protein [Anaerolineales bacterium]
MEESAPIQPGGRKPARPLVVTLLAILVLSITVLSLIRLVEVIILWEFLAQLPGVSPIYLALTGSAGAFIGILVTLGLWTGRSLAPGATRVIAVLFIVYNYLERWWLSSRNGEQAITPFWVGLTLACLAFVFWSFSTPEAQAYFGERHE